MTLNLQDYFSAGSLTPEQKQKQIQFCNSLRTNRPGYEAEIKKSGQTVRGKCSATSGDRSGGKSTPKAQDIETFEQALQKSIKSKLDAGQKKEKVDAWAEDQRQAWARSIYDTTAGKATTGVSVKESKNYYDDKKLNEAKQLFNKLLKNI